MLPVVATAGAAAAYAVVVHLRDPNAAGNYPTCPWLMVTGTWCPGCGTLRATHALTNGDIGTALDYNPFAVVSLVGLAAVFVLWARRQWLGVDRKRMAPPWVLYSLAASITAFWVLRNVPGFELLAPPV